MLDQILRQYDFNLAFAYQLVEDLSEAQMSTKPFRGFENHPAFTLGHLVTGSAMMVEDLGGEMQLPAGWDELFLRKGPGDPRLPNPDPSNYPGKSELLSELSRQHRRVAESLLTKTDAQLHETVRWRFGKFMPTLLDLTVFMCINHEAMHLGQLSAWRRAMNLPSALAALK